MRRFLGLSMFVFPSFICRIVGFSSLSWTNREVSVLNSAFTGMPNLLIALNAWELKEAAVAQQGCMEGQNSEQQSWCLRDVSFSSRPLQPSAAVFLPLEVCLISRSLFDCPLQMHCDHCLAAHLPVVPSWFSCQVSLLYLSKIHHSDKVATRVLLQEEENLTSQSLDFFFLSHLDAISSSYTDTLSACKFH